MFCDSIYMLVLKRCKGGWFICIILEILPDKYADSGLQCLLKVKESEFSCLATIVSTVVQYGICINNEWECNYHKSFLWLYCELSACYVGS